MSDINLDTRLDNRVNPRLDKRIEYIEVRMEQIECRFESLFGEMGEMREMEIKIGRLGQEVNYIDDSRKIESQRMNEEILLLKNKNNI